jgi:ribosomal protein L2
MDKLRYGDKVLAVDNKINLVYLEIVDFTEVYPNKTGSVVKIYHKHGDPLIVSGIHLVYANDGKIEKFMMAKDLKVGMKLMSPISKDTRLSVTQYSEITHIDNCYETG